MGCCAGGCEIPKNGRPSNGTLRQAAENGSVKAAAVLVKRSAQDGEAADHVRELSVSDSMGLFIPELITAAIQAKQTGQPYEQALAQQYGMKVPPLARGGLPGGLPGLPGRLIPRLPTLAPRYAPPPPARPKRPKIFEVVINDEPEPRYRFRTWREAVEYTANWPQDAVWGIYKRGVPDAIYASQGAMTAANTMQTYQDFIAPEFGSLYEQGGGDLYLQTQMQNQMLGRE
jgi:hypothetical protein